MAYYYVKIIAPKLCQVTSVWIHKKDWIFFSFVRFIQYFFLQSGQPAIRYDEQSCVSLFLVNKIFKVSNSHYDNLHTQKNE